jgi:hypothetical protein
MTYATAMRRLVLTGGNIRIVSLNTLYFDGEMQESESEVSRTPLCKSDLTYRHKSVGKHKFLWWREEAGSTVSQAFALQE